MCGFSETYIQKDMLLLTSAHAMKCSIIFSSRNKLIISLQYFPHYCYFSISTSKPLVVFKAYGIDFRAQRLMSQCRDAREDRSTVDDNIVDFSDITEQVLNGNFDHKLPPTFSVCPKTVSETPKEEDERPPTKQSKKVEAMGQSPTVSKIQGNVRNSKCTTMRTGLSSKTKRP